MHESPKRVHFFEIQKTYEDEGDAPLSPNAYYHNNNHNITLAASSSVDLEEGSPSKSMRRKIGEESEHDCNYCGENCHPAKASCNQVLMQLWRWMSSVRVICFSVVVVCLTCVVAVFVFSVNFNGMGSVERDDSVNMGQYYEGKGVLFVQNGLDLADYYVEELPRPGYHLLDDAIGMMMQDEEDGDSLNVSLDRLRKLPEPVVLINQASSSKSGHHDIIPFKDPKNSFVLRHQPNVDRSIRAHRFPKKEDVWKHGPRDQSFAILTRKGYKGPDVLMRKVPNQDSAIVWKPAKVFTDQQNDIEKEHFHSHQEDFLIGIFDGHGNLGHITSKYIADELPKRLGLLNFDGSTSSQMNNSSGISYLSTEDNIKKLLEQVVLDINNDVNNGKIGTDNMSGSTGSFILRWGNKIYGVNTGDSRTFVFSVSRKTGVTKILYINREDKPHLPEERSRIEASQNGRVIQQAGDSSRVVVFNPNDGGFQALAMSRSIGEGMAFAKAGVIADPIIKVLTVSTIFENEKDIELFAVAVSDGLLGAMTPEHVVQIISESLHEKGNDIISLCEQLILLASELAAPIYRDDITIVLSRIKTI